MWCAGRITNFPLALQVMWLEDVLYGALTAGVNVSLSLRHLHVAGAQLACRPHAAACSAPLCCC
jgi:hypothetical protein